MKPKIQPLSQKPPLLDIAKLWRKLPSQLDKALLVKARQEEPQPTEEEEVNTDAEKAPPDMGAALQLDCSFLTEEETIQLKQVLGELRWELPGTPLPSCDPLPPLVSQERPSSHSGSNSTGLGSATGSIKGARLAAVSFHSEATLPSFSVIRLGGAGPPSTSTGIPQAIGRVSTGLDTRSAGTSGTRFTQTPLDSAPDTGVAPPKKPTFLRELDIRELVGVPEDLLQDLQVYSRPDQLQPKRKPPQTLEQQESKPRFKAGGKYVPQLVSSSTGSDTTDTGSTQTKAGKTAETDISRLFSTKLYSEYVIQNGGDFPSFLKSGTTQ